MVNFSPLLAVHIADGFLSPWVLWPDNVLAAVIVLLSTVSLTDEEVPRIGLFTAAVFVASQIHFSVYGVSVHLLLNAVAGVVLGRRCPIAIGVAVFLQALLFAHGGLTTWGVNTLTMAVPALIAGALFRTLPNRPVLTGWLLGLGASLMTVVFACITVFFGGTGDWLVVGTVFAAHLPVILLEGLITGTLVAYLSKVKPEWLGTRFIAASTPSTALPTAQTPR